MDKENPIYVVGGGPTIKQLNLQSLRDVPTICVNKTAFYVPNPSYLITMDYTFIRKVTQHRIQGLQCSRFFVVNTSVPYIQVNRGVIMDTRSKLIYGDIYGCFDSIILSRHETGLGTSFRDFRCGNNSGHCALQLAIALGFTRIYLVGIDLQVSTGHTHFHEGYNEAYSVFGKRVANYEASFVQGITEIRRKCPDIEIISCSSVSPLNRLIPFRPLEETL